MSKVLTGIKDIDLIIISSLTDSELGKICQVNKYVNTLCNDENFWRNRTVNLFVKKEKVYENAEELNNYRSIPWRDFYKYLMNYVNLYIQGKYTSSTKRPVRYLDNLAYTFHKNGGILLSLLDQKKYDELNKFLNTHLLVSPINENNLYLNIGEEQFSYLVGRFLQGDLRFNLNDENIIEQILRSNNDNYEILLNHVDPNIILKIISEKRLWSSLSQEKIDNIFYSPEITLETLRLITLDRYISDELRYQIDKLIEHWP